MRCCTTMIALALLAACGSEPSDTAAAPPGDGATEHTIDANSGETTMRITTPRGEARMRSGQGVPISLPDGFSLYPGSTIITNTLVNQPAGTATLVVFEAPAAAPAVIAHFKALGEQAGYTIEVEATMNETMMLAGKRKDGTARFMVSTGASADGTTSGQLVMGKGD